MLHRLTGLLATIVLCLTVVQSGPVRAEQATAAQKGPAEVISDVTAQVMTVVAEADTYFDQDPTATTRKSTEHSPNWWTGEVLLRPLWANITAVAVPWIKPAGPT